MAKYKYNGQTLPGIPKTVAEDFGNRVIVYYNNDYFLYCANGPFFIQPYDGEPTIFFPVGSGFYLFECNLDSTEWSGGLVEPTEVETINEDCGFIPAYSTFIWCNTDICDDAGNVVHTASDPVPVFDLQDFLNFLAAGLCCKGTMAKKEPVAYLYNGVRLPKLPEWDKRKWPRGYIEENIGGYFLLLMQSVSWGINSYGQFSLLLKEPIQLFHVAYEGYGQTEEWEDYGELPTTENSSTPLTTTIIWSNFDWINEDGSVFLAASDPVPVYE